MAEENKKTACESEGLEAAMKRLEAVLEEMSAENVELERALLLYEEGVRLVRICAERIEAAERRINILKTNANGEVEEIPFEPASEQ